MFSIQYIFVLKTKQNCSSEGNARKKIHILINPLKQNWTFLFFSVKQENI